MSSPMHAFDINLACKYGIEEAVLLHLLATYPNLKIEEIVAHLSYIDSQVVVHLIHKLENLGLIGGKK